jgi:hypothetical protein
MKTLHKILGIVCIIVGAILYITPMPGTSLLIIFGFILLMGKTRTLYFFKEILGGRLFKFLKVKQLIKKI